MSKNLKHKDKERRKERYDKLRAIGYTSNQANRFKDYSDYKIECLIEAKDLANQNIAKIADGARCN